jgi:hypothetical protein
MTALNAVRAFALAAIQKAAGLCSHAFAVNYLQYADSNGNAKQMETLL